MRIRQRVANGLPAREGAILAATQRPLATSALTDLSGAPAWKTIPSWAVIGTADHIIPKASQLAMAKQAGAHITEVNAPHLSMISDPGVVTRVIIQAAKAAGRPLAPRWQLVPRGPQRRRAPAAEVFSSSAVLQFCRLNVVCVRGRDV